MPWQLSYRADPVARDIADRHYNRQSPGSAQFVPPGRCMVLLHSTQKAVWVTSFPFPEWTQHDWAGAWINSLFRNEGAGQSSTLIREAAAHTRWFHANTDSWATDAPPDEGLVTFVDADEVASENPGYCYQCAGFSRVGYTQGGLHVWQLPPQEMPEPTPPTHSQLKLFAA